MSHVTGDFMGLLKLYNSFLLGPTSCQRKHDATRAPRTQRKSSPSRHASPRSATVAFAVVYVCGVRCDIGTKVPNNGRHTEAVALSLCAATTDAMAIQTSGIQYIAPPAAPPKRCSQGGNHVTRSPRASFWPGPTKRTMENSNRQVDLGSFGYCCIPCS